MLHWLSVWALPLVTGFAAGWFHAESRKWKQRAMALAVVSQDLMLVAARLTNNDIELFKRELDEVRRERGKVHN